jgi:hypothetical protein
MEPIFERYAHTPGMFVRATQKRFDSFWAIQLCIVHYDHRPSVWTTSARIAPFHAISGSFVLERAYLFRLILNWKRLPLDLVSYIAYN